MLKRCLWIFAGSLAAGLAAGWGTGRPAPATAGPAAPPPPREMPRAKWTKDDFLKAARANDHRPFYILNQVGIPKRPEIKPADFAKALDDEPVAIIPFEPQIFGTAANNGQMIAEVAANHKVAETFRQLAQILTGRSEAKKSKASLFTPLLQKLRKRQS